MDELPIFHCWRCDFVCDVDWINTGTLGETEPSFIQGAVRCTNPRCKGRFDRAAHAQPTPEQLREHGQRALDAVNQVWTEL
jgi:hypothetical protein